MGYWESADWATTDIDPMAEHIARHRTTSPYRRLAMAVIEQLVNDLRFVRSAPTGSRPRGEHKNYSKQYFKSVLDKDIASTGLDFWCSVVGLNVDCLRKQLQKISDEDSPAMKLRLVRRVQSRSAQTMTLKRTYGTRRAYVRRMYT